MTITTTFFFIEGVMEFFSVFAYNFPFDQHENLQHLSPGNEPQQTFLLVLFFFKKLHSWSLYYQMDSESLPVVHLYLLLGLLAPSNSSILVSSTSTEINQRKLKGG